MLISFTHTDKQTHRFSLLITKYLNLAMGGTKKKKKKAMDWH